MRRGALAALIVLVLGAGTARAEAPAASWEPARTFALLVGTLEWRSKSLAAFPKEDRRDRALERRLVAEGVPRENVVFLEDREATRAAVLRELGAIVARATPGSTLILYYAGHGLRRGEEVFFASWDADPERPADTAIPLREVGRTLRAGWKGERLLLLADCCHSGALGAIVDLFEGAGPPFAACLASATASNVSTGEWTFTDSILAAFSGEGAIDADGDRVLTFAEVEAHVAREMRFREAQLSGSRATRGFGAGFSLRPVDAAKVRAAAHGPWRVGEYAETEWKGKWYRVRVIDAREGERRVHYLGFGAEWDEWVPAARLRAPVGLAAREGEAVEVEWEKKWWPARIVRVDGDFAFVHYDGWGPEWDEWVTAKRMRPRKR